MKEQLRARLGPALEAAEKAAARLRPSPRRTLVLGSLATARDAAASRSVDHATLLEAVRATTAPALVSASEGDHAEGLLEALAEVHNALLGPQARNRLAAARLPRDVDELTRVTVGQPSVVCVRRAPFEAVPERSAPVEADDASDVALTFDEGLEADASGDVARDAPRPEVAPSPVRPPAPDWREEEGQRPAPVAVRLDPERRTAGRSELYVRVIQQALESIAALARDRDEGPFFLRPDAEARILALTDAILGTPGDPIRTVLDHWGQNAERPGGHDTWAAAFALARFEGGDALAAVHAGLASLPSDAELHVPRAADALSLVPHPDLPALVQDLLEAEHPLARAVGVDLAGRSSTLAPEALRGHLLDPNRPVMLAALRSVARIDPEEGTSLRPLLERWIHLPDRSIAFAASRCLLAWGATLPYDDLVGGGRLETILGPLGLEILVLAGDAKDRDAFARIARKVPVNAQVLSAVGRFGHPEAWSVLVHSLADEDLVDDASRALETLFGPIVEAADARNMKAWKTAIAAKQCDPERRYRLGETWSPRVVATELEADVLGRRELEGRLLELTVRAAIEARPDLNVWGPPVRASLLHAAAEARRAGDGWARDGWHRDVATSFTTSGMLAGSASSAAKIPARVDRSPSAATADAAPAPDQLPSYLRRQQSEAAREASGTQPRPSRIAAHAARGRLTSTTFSSGAPTPAPALPFTPQQGRRPEPVIAHGPPPVVIRSGPETLTMTMPSDVASRAPAMPFVEQSEPKEVEAELLLYTDLYVALGRKQMPVDAVLARFGLDPERRKALDALWERRFAANPTLRTRWMRGMMERSNL